jgi:putative PIN family toxin of toxin-antitoxin system
MTPRLVIDANVLFSGLVARPESLSYRCLEASRRGATRLVFSQDLMDELERTLEYPRILALGITPALAFGLARQFYELGEFINPVQKYDWPTLKDRKDWHLLDLLYQSSATALLTKDNAVLKAGQALKLPVHSLADAEFAGLF